MRVSIRILIVDDEKTLVYYLRQTLQLELPDSTIDTAYSGEEALSLLAGRSYDLILADMRMPGFDGLALIRGVRYVDPQVPIILMTGFGNTALEREAQQLGVDHYVDKPFDVAELMTTVHKLLGQEANADE
jgi:YesN/AraC family two-component response regulator